MTAKERKPTTAPPIQTGTVLPSEPLPFLPKRLFKRIKREELRLLVEAGNLRGNLMNGLEVVVKSAFRGPTTDNQAKGKQPLKHTGKTNKT